MISFWLLVKYYLLLISWKVFLFIKERMYACMGGCSGSSKALLHLYKSVQVAVEVSITKLPPWTQRSCMQTVCSNNVPTTFLAKFDKSLSKRILKHPQVIWYHQWPYCLRKVLCVLNLSKFPCSLLAFQWASVNAGQSQSLGNASGCAEPREANLSKFWVTSLYYITAFYCCCVGKGPFPI